MTCDPPPPITHPPLPGPAATPIPEPPVGAGEGGGRVYNLSGKG